MLKTRKPPSKQGAHIVMSFLPCLLLLPVFYFLFGNIVLFLKGGTFLLVSRDTLMPVVWRPGFVSFNI